jgi:hypothetical protein
MCGAGTIMCRCLLYGSLHRIIVVIGGSVVDVPESCTVLVTDKVRRTYKFLCIMGQGKPIVSPEWLVQCQLSGSFLGTPYVIL